MSVVRSVGQFGLLVCCAGAASGGVLSRGLAELARRDTSLAVWVVFSHRPQKSFEGPRVAPRAVQRRQRAGCAAAVAGDMPVRAADIAAVISQGATFRRSFPWARAASFSVSSARLHTIASLSGVLAVVPVGTYRRAVPRWPGPAKRLAEPGGYGMALAQAALVHVPLAHEYLARVTQDPPGSGVLIGFFDTGFWFDHPCLAHLRSAGRVVGDSDFVSGRSSSIVPYRTHGAAAVAVSMGWDPGSMVGPAWGARCVIAGTEDTTVESHVEEDHWAAALVWAESLGVDIVNSSLGYRYGFDAPDESYTYEDMDGRTTIVARAAAGALARGMIVVSSAGNDGSGAGTINSPADAEGILAVGATDAAGRVTSFSSRGPTVDGRVKPDLAAMGGGVTVPDNGGDYILQAGTSFSSPMVAGIAALVRQCRVELSPEEVLAAVLGSCRYAPSQDTVDNEYGHGIPSALLGCMKEGEVVVVALDNRGQRASGVRVVDRGGVVVGEDERDGFVVATVPAGQLPARLWVSRYGTDTVGIEVGRTPELVYVTLPGLPDSRLVVFPNVVRASDPLALVTVEFIHEGNVQPRPYVASLRAVDGALVWRGSGRTVEGEAHRFTFDCRNSSGRRLLPGTYIFVVECDNTVRMKKLLIVG